MKLFIIFANNAHREKLVFYSIQYRNLLKNKYGCVRYFLCVYKISSIKE